MFRYPSLSRAAVLTAAALGIAACSSIMPVKEASLYDRLGGKPAITAVIDDFVGNVAADARINGRFANTDIARLKARLVEQVCAGTGGPCTYTGRDMKSAHAGMGITEAEFTALVQDLVKTLDKFKVPAREKNELLGILGSMKPDIVAAHSGGIAYPEGYRAWYHVKTRLNGDGHSLAANVGFQHVYANDAALAGLKSGQYADGATLVLDRLAYGEGEDKIVTETGRKVLLVMVKDARRYAGTGGWGFEAFKGGDRAQRVVQDGGAKCFSCHAPLSQDGFVFSKLRG